MPGHSRNRVIAVEEHFSTAAYVARTADMAVMRGEEDEHAWTVLNNSRMRSRLMDVDVRLADMDAAGVDVSLLSLNPPGVQLWRDADQAAALASEMNDYLAGIVGEHPCRFGGLAAVAPQNPAAAAAEIGRAVSDLGLNGVLISSHTAGHYLDEVQNRPILEALEAADATLYLHPRMPSPAMLGPFKPYGLEQALWGFQAEAGTHALRLIMSGVLDRFPHLRIVLGHLGEGLPFWLWRLDNLHAKMSDWGRDLLGMVDLELTPSEYFQRNFFITTSGMSDPVALDYCLRKVTATRILFAIDYPYEDSAVATGFLSAAKLDDTQRALISHANAENLFRIDRPGHRVKPRACTSVRRPLTTTHD